VREKMFAIQLRMPRQRSTASGDHSDGLLI
jgi:hypothetical protein